MATINNIEIPSLLLDDQGSDPSTPASGFSRVYSKSDGLYIIDDAGTVTGPFAASVGGLTLVNPFIGPFHPLHLNDQSLDLGAANRAIIVPFQVFADVTVDTVWFVCANATGNMCAGIYDASLARLGTTGSVAIPGTGKQSVALTGSVALSAGTLYYAAFSHSSTTAKFYGCEYPASINPGVPYFRRMESAVPLPDPFVVAADNDLGRAVAVWFEAV